MKAISLYFDDISFASLKNEVVNYSKKDCRQDIMTGLSVALLSLPQAMTCALVAGLPLTCGIFAAIFATLIASAFGSSRFLLVGPSTSIALLIQSATSDVLFTLYRDIAVPDREILALHIMMQLAFLVGVIQLIAAAFKLGRLTQFVSHSVVVGYIAGTAVAITISQLFPFLGVPAFEGVHSLYTQAVYIVSHLHVIHWPTAIVGLTSLLMLWLIKSINKKIPAAVIMLIGVSVAVHLVGLSSYNAFGLLDLFENIYVEDVTLIGDVVDVDPTIPHVDMPYFNAAVINKLLPVAFAIALLSILETVTVAKSISASSGLPVSVNQEMWGIGIANFFTSLIGAIPSAGSPSRSSLLLSNGGKTRFAGIFNALWVALFMLFFSYFITRIPLAALSAILLHNVVNIVNKPQFKLCHRATSSDAFVLWVTLAACIFFSLDIAFYIGVIISITLYLKKAAAPQLVECSFDSAGHVGTLSRTEKRSKKQVRMINVRGELFFGAADLFQSTLKSVAEDDEHMRVIILRLKNARDIDATACLALQWLNQYLRNSGRQLIACSLTQQNWEVLENSGLVELMGKENIFLFDEANPHVSEQLAVKRANAWIAAQTPQIPAEAAAVEAQPQVSLPQTATLAVDAL